MVMGGYMMKKKLRILLVEDNPGDVGLTKEAFSESQLDNVIEVVSDGIEAMAYLKKEGKYVNVLKPDLILLDLNLPKKDGREVLADIKKDPLLKVIPVVVLTTSDSDNDVLKSYESQEKNDGMIDGQP